VLLGAFQANPIYAVFAATGVILAAIYLFWMFQRVFYEKVTHPANEVLRDLSAREILTLAPIIALIVFIGVYPQPFLEPMQASIAQVLAQVVR